MTNLILGAGKLGKEISKQTGWDVLDRGVQTWFDFCDINTYFRIMSSYDTIINCVGNTNTYSNDKEGHLSVNFKAVCKLVDYCNDDKKRLVHISTDHVYCGSTKPASEENIPIHSNNWYSYSKLLGDGYVQAMAEDYLLIRTSFKPYPYPYDNAITTQKGNFDYIDIIANYIIILIKKRAFGTYNVGTEVKTIYDLAVRCNPDVIKSDKILNETMPRDVTMDISKLRRFIREN